MCGDVGQPHLSPRGLKRTSRSVGYMTLSQVAQEFTGPIRSCIVVSGLPCKSMGTRNLTDAAMLLAFSADFYLATCPVVLLKRYLPGPQNVLQVNDSKKEAGVVQW